MSDTDVKLPDLVRGIMNHGNTAEERILARALLQAQEDIRVLLARVAFLEMACRDFDDSDPGGFNPGPGSSGDPERPAIPDSGRWSTVAGGGQGESSAAGPGADSASGNLSDPAPTTSDRVPTSSQPENERERLAKLFEEYEIALAIHNDIDCGGGADTWQRVVDARAALLAIHASPARSAHQDASEPVAWMVEPATNDPSVDEPPWLYGNRYSAEVDANVVKGRALVPLYRDPPARESLPAAHQQPEEKEAQPAAWLVEQRREDGRTWYKVYAILSAPLKYWADRAEANGVRYTPLYAGERIPLCLGKNAIAGTHHWEWTDYARGDEELRCIHCALLAKLRGEGKT